MKSSGKPRGVEANGREDCGGAGVVDKASLEPNSRELASALGWPREFTSN